MYKNMIQYAYKLYIQLCDKDCIYTKIWYSMYIHNDMIQYVYTYNDMIQYVYTYNDMLQYVYVQKYDTVCIWIRIWYGM